MGETVFHSKNENLFSLLVFIFLKNKELLFVRVARAQAAQKLYNRPPKSKESLELYRLRAESTRANAIARRVYEVRMSVENDECLFCGRMRTRRTVPSADCRRVAVGVITLWLDYCQ